ncbi:MAG TPA: hypothetical protein VN723_13160 [Rhizomicrobium sp.]|nr:hypothetical protein [Rhizomicrobium sp.]
MNQRDAATFALSLFGGLLLWTLTSLLGHQHEPWDAAAYWTVAYPLAVLLSAALAAFHPVKPWRWAATIIFSQLLVMIAGGSDFSLLPLGLLLLVLLSLPAIAAAFLAAWLRTGLLSREP